MPTNHKSADAQTRCRAVRARVVRGTTPRKTPTAGGGPPDPPDPGNTLLLETGDDVLLETGDYLLLES